MDDLRVLVINGGGVRGIIPARILQELTTIAGKEKNVTDLFDYIIGTSIGGIEAAALTIPSEDGRNPKYTTKDVVDIMLNDAQVIFPTKTSTLDTHSNEAILSTTVISGMTGAGACWLYGTGKIAMLAAGVGTGLVGFTIAGLAYAYYSTNLFSAKYSRDGIDGMLEKHFGNATLSETLIPISTVSYSLNFDAPKIWSTYKAKLNPNEDYYLKDAAGATSAAPTYFPPKVTVSPSGFIHYDVDGGIFANSPTFLGITELLRNERSLDLQKLIVVSIGTGKFLKKVYDPSINHLGGDGQIGWISPNAHDLIGKMMKGTENVDVSEANHIFGALRINPKLEEKFAPLDKSSPEHMKEFLEAVENVFISDHRGMLKHVVDCLESKNVKSVSCAKARDTLKDYAPEEHALDTMYHLLHEKFEIPLNEYNE
jgi:predicted acylesterase/phospholipase RssA